MTELTDTPPVIPMWSRPVLSDSWMEDSTSSLITLYTMEYAASSLLTVPSILSKRWTVLTTPFTVSVSNPSTSFPLASSGSSFIAGSPS